MCLNYAQVCFFRHSNDNGVLVEEDTNAIRMGCNRCRSNQGLPTYNVHVIDLVYDLKPVLSSLQYSIIWFRCRW